MSLQTVVADWLKGRVLHPRPLANMRELENVLRYMAKWRSQVIANTYVAKHGRAVFQGPFAGMNYVSAATEGALAPRLLGTYESELHPHIAAFATEGLDCVIDIGCAEGYYAVGLARLMAGATVYAYDIDPKARVACAQLAADNGVADRVEIAAAFAPETFAAFAGRKVLVFVDVEGAEDDLLDPAASPALEGMNLIVETHGGARPGVLQRLVERFSASHEIVRVDQQGKAMPLPEWLTNLGHLDQLLAVWEWRSKPTPWLVMRPRT
ncbi:class I SAM-dependent methyltransferase [Phenylobacterium sp.]|uniref:class I SAM-dependent methyltransferase n=1 Tax=Phenylobacterium sp. TaxID=1871053 RepID=UPI002FCACA0C